MAETIGCLPQCSDESARGLLPLLVDKHTRVVVVGGVSDGTDISTWPHDFGMRAGARACGPHGPMGQG
eukprot:1675872-Pyramimonas_sp.AAC.1